MSYLRNPEPKWLNEHLLTVDGKKIVKVVFWLLVLAVAYYGAVYQLIGPMPIN